MIATVHTKIAATWQASGLDGLFRAYWAGEGSDFLTLNDEQAAAGTPFPYCVYSIAPGTPIAKMTSNGGLTKRELWRYPCRFTIHAQQTVSKSAKELAANLADEVAAIYGGHSTIAPTRIVGIYQTSLVSQQGMRTETQNYSWILNYTFEVDQAVAY